MKTPWIQPFTRGIFLALLLVLIKPVMSQVQIFSGTRTFLDPQGLAIGYYTVINEIPYEYGLKGSEYISSDWQKAEIMLSADSSIHTGIPARINIRKNVVEIRIDGDVKLLSLPSVYSIYFPAADEFYVPSHILHNDMPYGFYKVLYNQRSALLCHYFTRIRLSNYTPHFDVGERDNRLLMDTRYYAIMDGEVFCLKGRWKKLAEQFQSNEDLVQFIIENRITCKDESDLIHFMAYFDSIRP